MAVLDIHKVSADVPGDLSGRDVIADQGIELSVGKYLALAGDPKLSIQERVTDGNVQIELRFVVGLAEPARVSEMETKHEIVRIAVSFLMRGDERQTQFCEVGLVRRGQNQLVGIGPSIGAHGHGFATPDQLGAALSEPPPA